MTEESPTAADAPPRTASYYNQTNTNTHDVIADRTGELMREAHKVSEDLRRATIMGLQEPDTETPGIAIFHPDGRVAPVPASFFDEYRDRPKRREGTAKLTRIESFIDHVNRFKSAASAIFAGDDPKGPSLTAVLDYHEPLAPEYDCEPDFCKHRAHFAFPLSPEWKTWLGKDDQAMGITEFAQFLEDNFVHVEQVADFSVLNEDIQHLVGLIGKDAVATPSKLLILSKGLTVHENAQVANHQNLSSGEAEIRFKTEHTDAAGEKLNIPKLFIITIPVFSRGDLYRIAARLRYRVSGGKVVFAYELWGLERVFETAFVEACNKAGAETGLPLFFGAPES